MSSNSELRECMKFNPVTNSNSIQMSFLKPGKGKMGQKIKFGRKIQKVHCIPTHAFSECDGISAIFQKGKSVTIKLLQKHSDLQDVTQISIQRNVPTAMIDENSINIFLGIYDVSSKEMSFDDYQYLHFIKLVTKEFNFEQSKFHFKCNKETFILGLLPRADIAC